ncbi:tumor necrosis factor-like [Stegostoma tigrinum]|uniref:tumor necrosis factor-like n=1 Tax=Stegostoma tigrinum TaxID=3053191 RepID=UPI0028701C92|nr:tumor necrosis factor-like [Stegostoma tigrinum]
MNPENKLQELENGGLLPVRDGASNRSCFWPALCALAVLGLLLVSSCLFLAHFGVLPSKQDSRPKLEDPHPALTTAAQANGLPRLMKQVGSVPGPRIAAHLTGTEVFSINEKGEVIWQNESDSTFTEGVEFRDNRLIIKRPGQYFVYTQVVFHSMGCEQQAIYLSHELAKQSASYPEEAVLLKATKSACHSHQRREPWYKTSYQGAIFEFLEGDEIFSRVNEDATGFVDAAEGKTFFGIFAV